MIDEMDVRRGVCGGTVSPREPGDPGICSKFASCSCRRDDQELGREPLFGGGSVRLSVEAVRSDLVSPAYVLYPGEAAVLTAVPKESMLPVMGTIRLAETTRGK